MEIRKNLVHEPSKGLTCMTPSRTVPDFKDDCDTNVILNRYVNTGVLTHMNPVVPVYGDFSEVPQDYGDALRLIKTSKEKFDALPSDVREKFDSDPYKMIKFLEDVNNRDEAVKLGLVKAPEVKAKPDEE